MRALTCVFAVLCALGCTQPQMANTCPESKDLRCMTRVVCERDEQRQCMVCACEEPYHFEESTHPPAGGPRPD